MNNEIRHVTWGASHMPPIGSFREEVKNVKIRFWRHYIITNVGSVTDI